MADLHDGTRAATAAAAATAGVPVPAAVAELAGRRRLGALLDRRAGRPAARVAGAAFGTAAGALVLAVPLGIASQSQDPLSAAFSVLHPLFTASVVLVLSCVLLGVRTLATGTRSHYRYADGLVQQTRSGPRAITWAEADRLEPVYRRRTDAGRMLGYRLRAHDGDSILIPLVRVGGRDRFLDGVLAAAQAAGLRIG